MGAGSSSSKSFCGFGPFMEVFWASVSYFAHVGGINDMPPNGPHVSVLQVSTA